MAISLTESAADRVRTFLASRGRGLGLRLGVRKTGCSGFAYVVNYADDSRPDDVVFEDQGVKVFVDPREPHPGQRHRRRLREAGPQRGLQVQQSQRQGRVRLRRELQRLKSLNLPRLPRLPAGGQARPSDVDCAPRKTGRR